MRTPIVVPPAGGSVAVEPLVDAGELFAALDHPEVWTHIPGGPPRSATELLDRLCGPDRQAMAVQRGTRTVGTTSFIAVPDAPNAIEIGATLLGPAVWGSGLNAEVKRIMLAAAFAHGAHSVRLRTDERNQRSAAAILKLPGVIERAPIVEPGIIRSDGTVRTSRVFHVGPPRD